MHETTDPFAVHGGFSALIAKSEGPVPPECRLYKPFKRFIDIVGSLFGLTLLLPLFPFLVLLIKLDSKGPLFFKQTRVGLDGRLFQCYKFRSMVVSAEALKDDLADLNEASGAAFKIQNDPRITSVGKFIRRSSLDEFPQLWNILKGDMSIVGPRPQIPSEVSQYTSQQARRLLVKPGLTCLWQVSGRSELNFEEWMAMDLIYVRRRCLKFDLYILARTIPAVTERKGAY
jgi:lipopolysaccharide/colanic/teichoic acid biosynthesis glycosyltransferase